MAMYYRDFKDTIKVGGVLTIVKSSSEWGGSMYRNHSGINKDITFPYTFKIEDVYTSDKYLTVFVRDDNGYRWIINRETLPFFIFKKGNNRKDRIENLNI